MNIKRIKRWFRKIPFVNPKKKPILPIFVLVAILFVANFAPGTYLTGWDNLHPEFSFWINIKRSLFAVWQEYQGLGLLGGMGHATDLPRQAFLLLLSFFLPENLLRYSVTFLALLVGSVGTFFLARFFKIPNLAASTAGIFYLLNLATIQAFYIPFETFTMHFASLPWIILASLAYFKKPSSKRLFWVGLAFFLASSSFYTPTIFAVTIFAVLAFAIPQVLLDKKLVLKQALIRLGKFFGVVFLATAYWLLPFAFFTVTSASEVMDAKINQMASEKIFLENQEAGTLANFALLKGFWFERFDFNIQGQSDHLMGVWREHFSGPLQLLGFLMFIVILVGIAYSVKKRSSAHIGLIILLFVSLIMIAAGTWPFSALHNLARENIPLFAQAFRFPFTKFSILAALIFSLFFAYGFSLLSTLSRKRLFKLRLYWVYIAMSLVLFYPAFSGSLFYGREQVAIPQKYLQAFDFFAKADSGRIANFPQHTYWDWKYYNWGGQGSGFLWYGIEQPILDRAFDLWSNKNEAYYWEMEQALYSQSPELFSKVLEKYQVRYLLIDRSQENPQSPFALYFDELEDLIFLSQSGNLVATFDELKIYETESAKDAKNHVFLLSNWSEVGPSTDFVSIDQAFLDKGHYIESKTPDIYYPFRSLFTGRGIKETGLEFSNSGEHFVFKHKIPESINKYFLKIPDTGDELVFFDKDLSNETVFSPIIEKTPDYVSVSVPKVKGIFSAEITPENPKVSDTTIFTLDGLPHEFSYLISIIVKDTKNRSLLFWLENPDTRKADVEYYLHDGENIFIQPPRKHDGISYILHFDNVSIGSQKSIAEVEKIQVNPIPYKLLKELVLYKDNSALTAGTYRENQISENLNVYHPNTSLYQVSFSGDTRLLVLSQKFDEGWKAYEVNKVGAYLAPIFGKEIKDHRLVNNWENGWIVPANGETKVVLIYLPQYLQYLGFALLLAAPVFLLAKFAWGRYNF